MSGERAANPGRHAVAVVGMVGRFPGAADVEALWQNLCAGREGITFFAADELDPAVPASLRQDPAYVRAKGLVADCDRFDAAFFGITPLEAQVMDPQQRILLELAWAALENAGHRASTFQGRIGVYVGANWNRYRAHCVASHPEVQARFGELNTALANELDFVATRISYKLGLRGPSCTVSTACSTSLVAIAQAAQALLDGDCDLAIAGAASITVPLRAGYQYIEGGMLSRDGHCRPFDVKSDGTTFNDGAGLVVLRRLADASADGDHVLAVVRGFAVNNDGADKVSFTAPSVAGQTAVVRAALQRAGVGPETIGFVETHGTATPLGDPIEVAALKRAFAGAGRRTSPCVIGSVKSSIGHLVHAAGVAGFVNATLAVQRGLIPPTLFFTEPNPRLQLEGSPFRVSSALQEWREPDHPRRAGVSSFGVGGTNAHVVVEQAPEPAPEPAGGGPRVLCLSARTPAALERRIDDLRRHLVAGPCGSLDSIVFTLQDGREPMPHRAAWAVDSVADAAEALGDPRRARRGTATGRKQVAWLLPGHGSERERMGLGLYGGNATFRRLFDEAAERLAQRTGQDLRNVLFPTSGAPAPLQETHLAQPALLLFEYCLVRTLESMGLAADTLVGHSLGELVAATLAGVLSVDDALYVVTRRAEFVRTLPPGAMLVAHCSEAEASFAMPAGVAVAAVHTSDSIVLSGPVAAVDEAAASLRARGVRTTRLPGRHAFHSAMMAPAEDVVRSALRGVLLAAPARPIVSCVTGRFLGVEEATDPEHWVRQLCLPVRFVAALDTLAGAGDHVVVEVGPGSALTALALQHAGGPGWAPLAALPDGGVGPDAARQLQAVVAHCWAAGADVDFGAPWAGARPRRCALPTYPFERTRHWLDVSPARPEAVGAPSDLGRATAEPAQGAAPTNPRDRHEELARRIVRVLEESSGLDLAEASRASHLAELGFDSLLVTQVALALRKEFGLQVSFRDLMEKYGCIDELVQFVEAATNPAGATTARSAPGVAVQEPSEPGPAAPAAAAAPRDSAASTAPTAPTARASPGARIERKRSAAHQVTKAQQAHLDQLLADYARRTASSKAFAQRHRLRLADPRTVTGFHPMWKEVVYPIVTQRSRGARLWDLDGNEYIDLTNGFGCIFFGHSPDFVTEAVRQQLAQGIEIGPQSALAGEVAELFCELTGNERLAFATSGSEAVTAALRLARTVTGRDKVVLFEGSYHGIFDEVVVRAGAQGAALPASPGIPRSHTADVVVLPYGTEASLQRIEALGEELAAVMVEPVQSRRPELQPVEFLKKLRVLTEQSGTALIFDEVVTGFRTHPGGVQALFGIRADIATYGKVVAGGYPIGLLGGKARFLDALDGGFWSFGDESVPEVGVTFFAGTFVRHPVALAAAKAVLGRLRDEGPALQEGVARRTAAMVRDLKAFFAEVGVRIRIESFTSYFFFSVAAEEAWGSLLWTLLRRHGIHVWEHFPCFLTTSHTDEDVAAIVAAFERSVLELVENGLLGGDAAAVARRQRSARLQPPAAGARLGKASDGTLAWFVPDPVRPGRYLQLDQRPK